LPLPRYFEWISLDSAEDIGCFQNIRCLEKDVWCWRLLLWSNYNLFIPNCWLWNGQWV